MNEQIGKIENARGQTITVSREATVWVKWGGLTPACELSIEEARRLVKLLLDAIGDPKP